MINILINTSHLYINISRRIYSPALGRMLYLIHSNHKMNEYCKLRRQHTWCISSLLILIILKDVILLPAPNKTICTLAFRYSNSHCVEKLSQSLPSFFSFQQTRMQQRTHAPRSVLFHRVVNANRYHLKS